jgi:anti-sigma factor RsiW
MATGTPHARLRSALAAYALGAMGDNEAREVRDHLAVCLSCQGEAMRLQEAADLLLPGFEEPDVEVKARMRARIRWRMGRRRRGRF